MKTRTKKELPRYVRVNLSPEQVTEQYGRAVQAVESALLDAHLQLVLTPADAARRAAYRVLAKQLRRLERDRQRTLQAPAVQDRTPTDNANGALIG